MRILVIEDDQIIATLLLKLLKKHFVVDKVTTKAEADYLIGVNDYDLAIIDLGLPDGTGADLCQSWRQDDMHIPCLILSGATEVQSKLHCFEVGADDYVCKPFHSDELLSRVRALLRRAPQYRSHSYQLGECKFDSASKQLSYQNLFLQLNCKEGQLLELLLRHQGSIVTRTMIIEHVWENTEDMDTNTIEVHISRLRRRIENQFGIQCIKTIRNIGYQIPHEMHTFSSRKEVK